MFSFIIFCQKFAAGRNTENLRNTIFYKFSDSYFLIIPRYKIISDYTIQQTAVQFFH